MNTFWLKLLIWTKIAIFSVIAFYVSVFFWMNKDTVEVWYWFRKGTLSLPSVILILLAFTAGIITALLVRTFVKTLRQVRDLARKNKEESEKKELADMRAKAAMLKTREPAVPRPATAEPEASEVGE